MVLDKGNLSRILETAIVAARLAGQRAMEEIDFLKVSVKNNNELVTQADAHCQKIIIDRIKENYPDHGFLAEEGQDGNIFKQPPRGSEQYWWVIDPIDGTNNFAHKMPLFTISIAVMYEGEPIVGVIFAPATEDMFTAVNGGEAQLNSRRITTGSEEMNEFSSIGLNSFSQSGVPNWACQIIQKTKYRNFGSVALQLAYVASSGLIATVVSGVKLWDIAAGSLLADCAGAAVSDWQGGEIYPFDVDSYGGEELQVLAANKKVHPELVTLLKSE